MLQSLLSCLYCISIYQFLSSHCS